MEKLSVSHDAIALLSLMTEDIYQLGDIESVTQNEEKVVSKEEIPLPIVVESSPALSKQATIDLTYDYLGDNNRYVIILVNYPNHQFIADKDKEFLLKVLSALKMDLRDIAIVNIAKHANPNLTTMRTFFASNKLVSFTTDLKEPIFENAILTKYSISNYKEMKILAADALNIIESDTNLKKSLWNSLKLMFNVA